jgi:hypothetical protein
MHFVFGWFGFILVDLLCALWDGMGLVNKSIFRVPAGMVWVFATQVDMHFLCSLAWESTHV